MEEKKKAKQVALNANPVSESKESEAQEQRKATYEELNNYCIQLYQQNKQLVAQLKQVEMNNMFKRLDYLFKVVENSGMFDHDFVVECTDEIKQAMIIPEEAGYKEEK